MAVAGSQLSAAKRPKWHYITVGVILIAVAVALTVGWQILGVSDAARAKEMTTLRWVVYFLGTVLFLLLSAQFVFVVQIIVYAGAVMVLFLFVIALLGPARETSRGRLRFQTGLSALFALAFFGLLFAMLQGVQYRQPDHTDLNVFGTVQSIAVGLFTTYLYPFELTSVLLLVAAIGAIYLSRRDES